MPMFIGPDGNPEIWEEKPDGYYTVEEWRAVQPVSEPVLPTAEELMQRLREGRDWRLFSTDKYLLPDYPISAEKLATVKAYRQALRDLPAQEGAPFDGGGDETPWPAIPQL